MSQYIPPPPPPRDTSRPRTASNPQRYVPEAYGGPPQNSQPTTPMNIPGQQQSRPRGPSLAGQPIIGSPLVPNIGFHGTPRSLGQDITGYGASPGYFGTSPHGAEHGYLGTPHAPPYPDTRGGLHPQFAGTPQANTPDGVDRDGYMRPPLDNRRASVSSNHSHHSHHSHRSGRSGRSHHSRHSNSHRDSHDEGRRSADRRRSRDERYDDDDSDDDRRRQRDLKPIKRVDSHRPTWGDTIYGVWGIFKDALGPRDKY